MAPLLAKLGDAWIHPERLSSGRTALVIFLILTCVIVGAILALGPYPVTKFPKDNMYVLSQGDLLLKGMRPYVDYFSMHGPIPFLFPAIAMQFYGISMESVVLSQLLGAVVMGVLMYKVASARVSGFWAIFLAVSVELILVTCTPIGSKSWREFSCAMWYNALGYCMEAIIFLYLLAPSRSRVKLSQWTDHLVVASLLMASFLTKVSYFLPALVVFIVGAIILPRDRKMRIHGLVILIVAVASSFVVMAALGGSIPNYLKFLSMMTVKYSPLILALRFIHYTRTIGLFLLGLALLAWCAYEAGLFRNLIREGVLVVLMLGCIVASASTSAQDLEILPLMGVIPLGIAVTLILMTQERSLAINKYLIASALGIALLLTVHAPKNSILSWVFSHTNVPTLADPVERLSFGEVSSLGINLSPRVKPSLLAYMPKDWTDDQIDAIALLQEHGAAKDEVLYAAADVSFLNLLTDAEYPHAFVVWWPFIYLDEPEKIKLLDENLLADVDWIIRDNHYDKFWKYLEHLRGDYIESNFEHVGDKGIWSLYRRKTSN